jgi:hypothetical protein
MTLAVVYDRVQETTVTTGTGTITLAGAVTGFQSFAVVGNGNSTYYCITSNNAWEVGIGTYSTSGSTLSRTLISSSTGSLISLTGTSTVFITYPAEKAIIQDSNGNTYANSFTSGWAATVTAAGTTTLTVSSTYYQRFTGSTTQTVVLPNATTVALGQGFIIDNDSSGAVALQANGGGSLGSIVSGMAGFIFCEDNTTAAGSWSGYMFVPGQGAGNTQITWGKAGLFMDGSTISGLGQLTSIVATGTAPFVVASTTQVANLNAATAGTAGNVTGTVAVGNGGTGATTLSGFAYGNGTSAFTAATTAQALSLIGTVPVGNGGTGATTLSGIAYGNGTSAFTAATGAQISTALGSTSISGSAGNVTGTVGVSNGGLGSTGTPSNGQIPIGNGSTYTAGTLTAGVGIAVTNASGSITISNTQIPATTVSGTSNTITPTITTGQYNVTALAGNPTMAAPAAGVDGQKLLIRIKDNGTAKTAFTWTTTSGGYRAVGITLPQTTIASTPLYIACVYNAQDTFWDVIATSNA